MGKEKPKIMESLAMVDVNLNNKLADKEEESSLHDLIDVGLKSGKWFLLGSSYTIGSSHLYQSEFAVKNSWRLKNFLLILHIFFVFYLAIPFLTEKVSLSPCCLINWIKRGLHTIFVCCLITTHYCVEIKGRRMPNGGIIAIYKQCEVVQNKFKEMGIHFPVKSKLTGFGWCVSIGVFTACVFRQYIFATMNNPWYSRHSRTMSRTMSIGFWVANNETASEDVALMFGILGLLADGTAANFWYFGQLIHFFFILTIWLVFRTLNKAWESGKYSLNDVMDLHFQATKLLKVINELIAPLTFWSVVFNIVILCFWANYIAMDFRFKRTYIVALCNLIKIMVELLMEADVNWKAHRITDWLEESCTATEKFPNVNPVKLNIFTAQVYNQDCIGFRGLNYFVVTPRLVMTVVGIVITDSIAVNQFCHSY